MITPPKGLGAGGRALWRGIAADHELDAPQRAQLEEACRAKDRLDRLDTVLRGDVDVWARLTRTLDGQENTFELRIGSALTQANTTANTMKQLLAALRLPDAATGKRPQTRPPRGVDAPHLPSGVASLERARRAHGA